MSRPLAEDLPSLRIGAVVRAVRGGRGGPRHRRPRRAASCGPWTATGFSGWQLGQHRWRVERLTIDRTEGVLAVRVGQDGAADRVHRLALVSEGMRFGGARWWASCPGCGGRCDLVFFSGELARCRSCFGLAYRCQRLSAYRRAGARLARLGDRLAVRDLLDEPARPQGMRRARFARLLATWRDLSEREVASLPLGLAGWLR